MHNARRGSLFQEALEISAWLEADRDRPFDQRLHRDRKIAASISDSDTVDRVRHWWQVVRRETPSAAHDTELATRLSRARVIITFSMLFIGALAGAGASLAVFRYDGTWPINVVTAFAVLVLLQIALIAATLILMLPRIPGLRALQSVLGALNPAAIAAAAYRRVGRQHDQRASLLVLHQARGPVASRFARWQIVVWSQCAAVAFNVAALVCALGLITFTDLAFGWSSTLRFDSEDILRLTRLLSTPWRDLWPAAVPTAELIEQSRFFRLAASAPTAIAASELTGWWPFLLAAVTTYGLFPRCCLLLLAVFRLRAATRNLLLDDPRVRALLDRMNAEEMQLGSNVEETAAAFPDRNAQSAPAMSGDAVVIVWSGALRMPDVAPWTAKHLRWRVVETLEAGSRTIAADAAVIDRVATLQMNPVIVFVRGWEAPLLELQDFIQALRAKVGPQCSVVVVPVGANGDVASESQRSTWSRWTARVGDPALYLESGA
ncbi:DUF2868 domain-containing protein [Peristeroidobacter agariperforans]|uniref:DUF2868 domain-containing protein n=1 Tax=Peristeroidobacter agariperforans TaxID=268404 RepID=UPI001300430A|nr:DUF2868 domain-containing protein [Peristeroidobacter agariperforans]